MKKKFEFERIKMYLKHMSFEELEHYSIRNVLEYLNQFLRRPFYFFKYKNFLNIKSIE